MAKSPKTALSGGSGNVLYYEIANFLSGIDTRKDVMTAPAGSLRLLKNCHLTPGGEIEKRSAFTNWYDANSWNPLFGLISLNGQPYIVTTGGSGIAIAPTPTSPGVYRVTPPAGASGGTVTLQEMTDWDIYNGKPFVNFLGYDASVGMYGSYAYYDSVYVAEAAGRALACRTYKEKMYGVNGRYLYFSAIGDPTKWNDPPPVGGVVAHNGSGFISIGSNDSDSENLISLEVYYDKMAIFSSLGCQLWFLDPDPSLNQYYQTLRDAGASSKDSVRQYVANDVYFLGAHGIRSLRARDLTTTAAVADVGSPIDPMIQDLIATRGIAGATEDMGSMQTVLSPRTGRLWMTAYDKIFVLSHFASPNIAAWSIYEPGFNIAKKGIVFADPYLFLLDTNKHIWRFGSFGTLTYDSCPVEIITPGLSFDKPASHKFYQGFDAVCRAQAGSPWNVQMCFDPTQPGPPWDQICTMEGPTTLTGRIPISGRGTHLQTRITHQGPGPASFAKMLVHYASSDTE